METDNDMLKLFAEFTFLDHSEGGIDVNVNILRKYITNKFHKAVPASRILITLSLIDHIILKLHNKDLDLYSVRENVLYMLSFEKFVEENPAGDDDNDDGESESM